MYNNVVKPYCRTCDLAQGFDLGTPPPYLWPETPCSTDATCHTPKRPRASSGIVPHRRFWPRSWLVHPGTRLDDPLPQPEFCAQGDCSLREAIIIANSNTSANTSIITFDVDGTFTLTQSGFGEDQAHTGDLDIRKDVFVLGNGAGKTVIDGGGIDRVFDVAGRSTVGIQGVTIQGGIAWDGGGGGILFSGGEH